MIQTVEGAEWQRVGSKSNSLGYDAMKEDVQDHYCDAFFQAVQMYVIIYDHGSCMSGEPLSPYFILRNIVRARFFVDIRGSKIRVMFVCDFLLLCLVVLINPFMSMYSNR